MRHIQVVSSCCTENMTTCNDQLTEMLWLRYKVFKCAFIFLQRYGCPQPWCDEELADDPEEFSIICLMGLFTRAARGGLSGDPVGGQSLVRSAAPQHLLGSWLAVEKCLKTLLDECFGVFNVGTKFQWYVDLCWDV